MVITAASIGERFGRRRVYVAGLALFSLASAACALAPSTTLLIAARAMQGLGAAIGIWGSIAGLAEAAGGRPVNSAYPPHLYRRTLPRHKEPR
jgi:MFS family permease